MKKQVGPYQIIEFLGDGHSSAVYLAKTQDNADPVAIKVFHIFLHEKEAQAKFSREVQLIDLLSHPGIVKVLDFDFDEETPYFTMPYASKGSLRKAHPEGMRVSPEIINAYVQQLASALQYAHNKKIIHCDLKPENVLVSHNDSLLLSDFGIAEVLRNTLSQSTHDGGGTPTYMAPEQFRGKPRPASDQYGLAVMVYEWLCGEPPFQGKGYADLMEKHLHQPVPALQKRVPDIHEDIEAIVMRALAKEPGDRFYNIQTFANEFIKAQIEAFQQKARPSNSEYYDTPRRTGILSQGDMAQDERIQASIGSTVVKLRPFSSGILIRAQDTIKALKRLVLVKATSKTEQEILKFLTEPFLEFLRTCTTSSLSAPFLPLQKPESAWLLFQMINNETIINLGFEKPIPIAVLMGLRSSIQRIHGSIIDLANSSDSVIYQVRFSGTLASIEKQLILAGGRLHPNRPNGGWGQTATPPIQQDPRDQPSQRGIEGLVSDRIVQRGGPGGSAAAMPMGGVAAGRVGMVRIEEGKEPGRVYEVRKEALSIGRSRESDIFLEDLAVSRLHASIISQGNGNFALRDEGSANGTKVNGQQIKKYEPYPLQDGDKIRLGQTVLVFGRR